LYRSDLRLAVANSCNTYFCWTFKNFIDNKTTKKGKSYIFIDEIQEIADFEKALRSLNTQENNDIYCTGSNANLLASDLANLLGGRYIEIILNPIIQTTC